MVNIATEIEEASKTVKAQLDETNEEVHRVVNKNKAVIERSSQQGKMKPCASCGKNNHERKYCRFKDYKCNYCDKNGHIEAYCFAKKRGKRVTNIESISKVTSKMVAKIMMKVNVQNHSILFEVDTGSKDNFISVDHWKRLGKPKLLPCENSYISATSHPLPIIGYQFEEVRYD